MTGFEIMEYIKKEILECEERIGYANKYSDTKKEIEYLANKKDILESLYIDLKNKQ